MHIRERRQGDLQALVELFRSMIVTGYPRWMPKHPETFLAPENEVKSWVAVEGDWPGERIVGHAALHETAGDAGARPPHRRHLRARLPRRSR